MRPREAREFWVRSISMLWALKACTLGQAAATHGVVWTQRCQFCGNIRAPDCSSCIWGLLNTPPDCYSSSLVRKSAV